MKWLISLYPKNWRDRYGDELDYLLEQKKNSILTYIDVFRGALDAWNIDLKEGKLITRKNYFHFNKIVKGETTMQKGFYILFGLSAIVFLIFANSATVNNIQYETLSMDEIKEFALQEDSEAQMLLAYYYQEGVKLEKDDDESLRWYIKSAENGNTNAMVNLGNLYSDGILVDQNLGKAFSLQMKAAELGNTSGMFNLGKSYELGRGVQKDEEKARYWIEKSDVFYIFEY